MYNKLNLYNILASLFFLTYEDVKSRTQSKVPEKYHSLLHMCSASLAEMVNFDGDERTKQLQ